MNFSNIIFKRKFGMTMFKDQRIALGKMTFTKDFVNDRRGDLYPVTEKSADCMEKVEQNRYIVEKGTVQRMMCQFFPYASYEMTAEGAAGFVFAFPDFTASISCKDRMLVCVCGERKECVKLPDFIGEMWTMIVSCRPGSMDVYFRVNEKPEFVHTFQADWLKEWNRQEIFSNGYAAVEACEGAVISAVSAYIDNGISQADMRPIRYENGEIMVEQGKVYLTMSIRLQAEMMQGIFAWVPGTAELELTGALFYDAGDGRWCGDVAASVLYHRREQRYYLWVCSFSHGHILGHAVFEGDIRFGVNVVDIELMKKAPENAEITVFAGMQGDEDPDFFFDEASGKWLMAICRIDPAVHGYRYVFFESDRPFDGYRYIGKGLDGAETGGSFVRINGEIHFVCGNDFGATSDYRIYDKNGMQKVIFNYPDGGFRGWGTLMPVKLGSRTRYFWMTFDRHNGSGYNWSYGNVYVFEAEVTK